MCVRLVGLVSAALAACVGGESPGAASSEFWSHRVWVVTEAYGDQVLQRADVYQQGTRAGEWTWFEAESEPRPTLIWFHGGGWIQGDRATEAPMFIPFLERGWNVVNANYRVGPGTAPQAVDDAVCAIGWAFESASRFRIDRSRVVLGGQSAGGHLALVAPGLGESSDGRCTIPDSLRVAAVVNWFGITDLETLEDYLHDELPEENYAGEWIGSRERVGQISEVYSPIRIADQGFPPILSIHGSRDTVVPHSQATRFHDRLSELGVVHDLITLQGGSHGGFSDGQYQTAFRAIFDFLSILRITE